jgi:DNA polymerase III epsilon subunit family exonuclease
MALAVQRSFDDLGTPLAQVTFVVLDVETTGGSPATDCLTEVAAARYRGGELLGTYRTFVRPDIRIPPAITALTGISDAMVADAPPAGEMLASFLEFVGGAVIVGHNVRFDLSFLNHALESTGRPRLANATVDTLALARRLVRDMVPNCKLGTLASSLRLEHQPCHRALDDVLATGDLLHALLERAGTYGIVGLEELLALPTLVGHPQAAKLRLTTRLPHRPGVYWFCDAKGDVLYVGKATDLQSRVRSYFSGDTRPKVGQLLRQLDAVHHRVCPGPLTAAVLEGRLIRAWAPPFNRQGKVRRRSPNGRAGASAADTVPERRRRRRGDLTVAQLEGDPAALLAPLAEQVVALAKGQRYEEAAAARDEAGRLRHLIERHRRVESLRRAGVVVLHIEGEGTVELDGGLLVEAATLFDDGSPGTRPPSGAPADARAAVLDPAFALTADGHDNERRIVAQWLAAHPERVRILQAGTGRTDGLAVPAVRIPELGELTGRTRLAEPSGPPERGTAG